MSHGNLPASQVFPAGKGFVGTRILSPWLSAEAEEAQRTNCSWGTLKGCGVRACPPAFSTRPRQRGAKEAAHS